MFVWWKNSPPALFIPRPSRPQATWVEGAVEALMPSSSGSNTGTGGSSGNNAGKSGGQGSFRKIGGAWRRVGGWGKKGGKGGGGGGGATEDSEQPGEPQPPSEADMDAPLPQLDHERCENFWLSCCVCVANRGEGDHKRCLYPVSRTRVN